MPSLDTEERTYRESLPEMLKGNAEGQFVIIQGDRVCRFEATYEQALSWGYENFGLEPFLVRRVMAVQPEVYFSHYAGLSAG